MDRPTPSDLTERALIERGYRPGVIGRIVEMHARFYSRSFGFGPSRGSMRLGGSMTQTGSPWRMNCPAGNGARRS